MLGAGSIPSPDNPRDRALGIPPSPDDPRDRELGIPPSPDEAHHRGLGMPPSPAVEHVRAPRTRMPHVGMLISRQGDVGIPLRRCDCGDRHSRARNGDGPIPDRAVSVTDIVAGTGTATGTGAGTGTGTGP